MSGAFSKLGSVGATVFALSLGCNVAAPKVDYPEDALLRRSAETAPPDEDKAGCMTGCAVAAPQTPDDSEIAEHLEAWSTTPLLEPGQALEWLLFHAAATRDYLERQAHAWTLTPERRTFLRRELSRTHAMVEMRIVDDHGAVRARIAETRVPLGLKQHLAFNDYDRVQPFEASGTVVRVGLGHIWTRY